MRQEVRRGRHRRVNVIGLLELWRIRQNVQIIKDVIVTHRDAPTD